MTMNKVVLFNCQRICEIENAHLCTSVRLMQWFLPLEVGAHSHDPSRKQGQVDVASSSSMGTREPKKSPAGLDRKSTYSSLLYHTVDNQMTPESHSGMAQRH